MCTYIKLNLMGRIFSPRFSPWHSHLLLSSASWTHPHGGFMLMSLSVLLGSIWVLHNQFNRLISWSIIKIFLILLQKGIDSVESQFLEKNKIAQNWDKGPHKRLKLRFLVIYFIFAQSNAFDVAVVRNNAI